MKWVTREHVKVDRVACPWLIRNFIDQEAEFIFVPGDTDPGSIDYGTPFDMKGVELGHHGSECSFDAIVRKYGLEGDKALEEVRKIVRGADTHVEDGNPMAAALVVLAEGFAFSCRDDREVLEKEFPMYDALYAYYREILA